MIRLRVSARYEKSRKKLGSLEASIDRAVAKFRRDQRHPGLNFESIKNTDNAFSIRVNLNFRIILLAKEDDRGPYYLLADVVPHDDAYRRR